MTISIEFGTDRTLTLPLESEQVIWGKPNQGPLLDDPAAAVAAALLDPLEFPAIGQMLATGDSVAIAVEPGVPQAERLVAGVIQSLRNAPVEIEEIALVVAPDQTTNLLAELAPEEAETIRLVIHNPDERNELSYLAANQQDEPIYINRTLGQADLVIPIGCLQPEETPGYWGVTECLYPTFADRAAQQRFWKPSNVLQPEHAASRKAESEEAVWNLGVQLTVQVVPAPGERLYHVLAGQWNDVAKAGFPLVQHAWQLERSEEADLVIAFLGGTDHQQTWNAVAQAVHAAAAVVQNSGAIAICCQLSETPGPNLRRLAEFADPADAIGVFSDEEHPDALAAMRLAQAMDRARLYLFSELTEEVVESIGMAYIADPQELGRLAQQASTCLILPDAGRLHISPHSSETAEENR